MGVDSQIYDEGDDRQSHMQTAEGAWRRGSDDLPRPHTGKAFARNVEVHLGLVGERLVELGQAVVKVAGHILLAVLGPSCTSPMKKRGSMGLHVSRDKAAKEAAPQSPPTIARARVAEAGANGVVNEEHAIVRVPRRVPGHNLEVGGQGEWAVLREEAKEARTAGATCRQVCGSGGGERRKKRSWLQCLLVQRSWTLASSLGSGQKQELADRLRGRAV